MTGMRVQQAASHRLDETYRYTKDRWGAEQAERYLADLFGAIDGLAGQTTASRPIPAVFEVDGYFLRYRKHIVYWRYLANGDIGIVTLLHERMHQIDRFKADFGF